MLIKMCAASAQSCWLHQRSAAQRQLELQEKTTRVDAIRDASASVFAVCVCEAIAHAIETNLRFGACASVAAHLSYYITHTPRLVHACCARGRRAAKR